MKKIVLHCSDSPWGNAAIIDHWHRLKGWKGIGYHYVILNGRSTSDYKDDMFDGTIETGRSIHKSGAHTKSHNEATGVCLIGKPGQFTTKQIDSTIYLINHIQDLVEDKVYVYQHSELDNKKFYCASLDMKLFEEWRKW